MPESTSPKASLAEDSAAQSMKQDSQPKSSTHKIRFFGIFVALCLLAFISSLDVAIITTALPTITAEIGGSRLYVWVANSFVFASAVLQPLFGQLANAFGRRDPMLACIFLFALGSGLAGGANSPGMHIAGRTIQGVGAGGIYVLLDIICCDLVPLRKRGKYLALMNAWAGVAAGLGPVVGGALAQTNWRWIFYMNLPICAVPLVAILLFMRVKTGDGAEPRKWTLRLKSIDWLGTLIFTPAMIAILFGLINGGIDYPWSSWRIILPLVLGGVGWIVFHIQQTFAKTPSVPHRLFANRTSAICFILTFFSATLIQAAAYFLPIFFQGGLGTTVLQSGINFLPYAIGTLGFAVCAGMALEKTGDYRSIHAVAFALSAIGFGLFTLLRDDTSRAKWAVFQLVASAGSGPSAAVLLPGIMAALPEADVASSTATYSFIRTFGYIWGVTIPSVIFNGRVNSRLDTISSTSIRDQLRDGAAYSFASQAHLFREQLPLSEWRQLTTLYTDSLRAIWWVGLGVSLVCLLLVAGEKRLTLRTELDTAYGIDDTIGSATATPDVEKSHIKPQARDEY